jgi:hypothetical protein
MTVLWIVLTVAVAAVGGWPVTAGILKAAASRTMQAADRSDRGETADPATDPAADSTTDSASDVSADPAVAPGRESPAPAPGAAHVPVSGNLGEGAGVLRGGLVIGLLERAAVVVAVLTDQPVAIAYVVAIKGLGRYPELKDTPAASERFIIGTLASLLWAAVIAVLAKVLLL